jgi:hypothetical protein
MGTLAGTAIKLTFVEKPLTDFPPLFYENGTDGPPMASVNAGNSDQLYVGGDGINGGFAKALAKLTLGTYATRHQALLAKARGGGEDAETYADTDPMAFSLVYPTALTSKKGGGEDGVCFVDVFAPQRCPNGVAANAAMLYVVPPCGPSYADRAAFLAAIRQTAGNVATTMGRYNKAAGSHGVPVIRALRLCLFSSGIYNSHGVSSNRIAEQIYAGLCDVLAKDDCGLTEVQLPVADPLFYIIQDEIQAAGTKAGEGDDSSQEGV